MTLLVDPVYGLAVGEVAADGFAQELTDSGVDALIYGIEQ